jgi:catechol 2,3-dioxygenase-like lactoylglutathione lyase family enzyme
MARSTAGQKEVVMEFNAGIITPNLEATKDFYTRTLGWQVNFENDFYLLLGSESGSQISFLQPNHPSQAPLFQTAFNGKGIYITVEVPNVDQTYRQIKASGTPIAVELRDEPWGDRHFAIVDPNGIGVDIVTYSPPADTKQR